MGVCCTCLLLLLGTAPNFFYKYKMISSIQIKTEKAIVYIPRRQTIHQRVSCAQVFTPVENVWRRIMNMLMSLANKVKAQKNT